MSIMFDGYYGHKNTGDDIFCIISEWAAKEYWKQNNVKFFGRHLPKRRDGSELNSAIHHKNYFKGQALLEYLYAISKVDKVIFSGGSLFNRRINYFSTKNILNHKLSSRKVKAGAVGISLGPFTSKHSKESIKSLLHKFSFISVRDKRSFEEAHELKLDIPIIESFDLGALLPEIYPQIQIDENEKPTIGISICRYETYVGGDLEKEKERIEKICDTVRCLAKSIDDLKIKILVFNGNKRVGDYEVSNQLLDFIPKEVEVEIVTYNSNPFFMWKAVCSCNVVLATRMHAGIFSCFSKTPFVQVEYHKKCTDFLNDVNYPEKFRIGDIEKTPKEVSLTLIDLLEENPFLHTKIEILKEKSKINFTETYKYISE